MLRIEWLFVHEDFRGRGVSDSLIAELVYQMHVTGIEATAVSLVVGDSWEPAIGSVFARWKFEFEPQMDPDKTVLEVIQEGVQETMNLRWILTHISG